MLRLVTVDCDWSYGLVETHRRHAVLQVVRPGFAGRPQAKPLPLGQRVVVHAEEGKGAKAAKEGGEKSAKSAKESGESKPTPAKKGGGGKDKFVGQYKSVSVSQHRWGLIAVAGVRPFCSRPLCAASFT